MFIYVLCPSECEKVYIRAVLSSLRLEATMSASKIILGAQGASLIKIIAMSGDYRLRTDRLSSFLCVIHLGAIHGERQSTRGRGIW